MIILDKENNYAELVGTAYGVKYYGIDDEQAILCYCLQGNCIDRADTAGCNGAGYKEGTSFTFNAIDRHAVVFVGINGSKSVPKGVRVIYVYVRRLTPTECARLQGMPDWWCADVPHADAPEYKMWGNGMALPNILYVMEGIAEKEKEETA